MGRTYAVRDGIVFIAEDPDSDPGERFSAHWESSDGQRFREGPEGVSAEEAIAWGREQAEVVSILVDGRDDYSAGSQNPHGLPVWPGGQDHS